MNKKVQLIIQVIILPTILFLFIFVFDLKISLKSNTKKIEENKKIIIEYIRFNESQLDFTIRDLVRENDNNKDLIRKINDHHIKILNLRDLYEILYNDKKEKINDKALEIKKITAPNSDSEVRSGTRYTQIVGDDDFNK